MNRKGVFLTAGLILLLCAGYALSWQPVQGDLMTRWADDITPENVWDEYPRPQMVRDGWNNLNGLWNYAITAEGATEPASWDGEILVPFCAESALSGVKEAVTPEQALWYQKTFTIDSLDSGERKLLHFGAADWQTTVWVNGQEVGSHTGGHDPFTFDITDELNSGENEIVVRVYDPTDQGYQPRGKQVLDPGGIMYTAVTGIWQTVWMETVPDNYIQSLDIVTDIDNEVVKVTVNSNSSANVELTALDEGRQVSTASGNTGEVIELPITDPKLWSPDSPFLYDLQVSLISGGQEIDSVSSYFGMRKIEVKKDSEGINRLFLNNEPMFQYGPLDQGWWPDGLYTPPSDEAMKYDIEMTKKFGMNMIRKHVKVEPARWYYLCDKMGVVVWQDMPSGDSGRNEESKTNYLKELKAMVDALDNFPSIVMWVPFNEGWGQHDTVEVVNWLEQYEPTRLVNEASGWSDRGSGDVSDNHDYPGPSVPALEEDRAAVLGEFGGLGMPVLGHTWSDEGWGYVEYETKEELTDAYVDIVNQTRLLIADGLSAAVYTQTTDVEVEVNGLMTYDRDVVKVDLQRAAKAARKLYQDPPEVNNLVPTSKDTAQQWYYKFSEPSSSDWYQPGFDPSAAGWDQGPGGFGTDFTPGSVVGTTWDNSDIWIRKEFNLSEVPSEGEISLNIHHDEDAQVYINGQLVKELTGYTTDYVIIPLSSNVSSLLNEGSNTIAIHCHQTDGGQFIDAGLVQTIFAENPDLTGDNSVGFSDLKIFAGYWLTEDCRYCGGADLNLDGYVNTNDFAKFAEYWLKG